MTVATSHAGRAVAAFAVDGEAGPTAATAGGADATGAGAAGADEGAVGVGGGAAEVCPLAPTKAKSAQPSAIKPFLTPRRALF